MPNLERTLNESRGQLIGIAYRMLGCLSDAEDVLQDAYLRVQAADNGNIKSLEAYLVTTVTRLCLDRLKSARAKREVYVGPWLPEPILDADQFCPQSNAELADDLSFALLMTLEKLTAAERAAFILHDVFETPFSQIAETLGKTEASCRQLAARARKSIKDDGPNRSVPKGSVPSQSVRREQHNALLTKFVAAVGAGNTDELQELLARDVVAYTDGGGFKTAALAPILGANNVSRFFAGLIRKNARTDSEFRYEFALINGLPGLLIFMDGQLDQTLSIQSDEQHIAAIYVVRNPEKLRSIDASFE